MCSVSEDLYLLVEETLGCDIAGLQITRDNEIIASFGEQDSYAQLIEVSGNCYKTNIFLNEGITPTKKEIEHIRKILNIFTGSQSDTASRLFSGAEILETITNKSTVDEVLKQLVDTLVGRGGFCRAGVMFLNEALLELRGVICADKSDKINVGNFKNCKLNFKTKNQLSDIMFYDRTEVVRSNGDEGLEILQDYFCDNVIVTGLGVKDHPIGILVACKDNYTENDKEALLLYGNICSLAIEFSKTIKQLELTVADLGNLRKTAVNSENLVKMGRLSATVAHELKNPLVAIGGFTKRMEQTAVNPQTKNYIKIVQSEVFRLERIVGDILTYSRKVDLQIEDIKLTDILDEVMEVLESCLCFSMINQTVKVSPELRVQADKDKLKQVIMNLVSNSVQEMPDGGELSVEALDGDRHITISVADTGGGIPADKREKIFEPFYTLKKTGTGLGLPLCKKIMTAHGGDVVVGDAGDGAVFTLVLPKRG